MPKLFGAPPSSFVRKTMLALDYKDVNYELVMTMPGSDDEAFRKANPVGKVPAFQPDHGMGFGSSAAIIAYIEKTHPEKALYPDSADAMARALFVQDYADTKLTEVISALYYQTLIGPTFFDHTTDEARVKEVKEALIPEALALAEELLVADEWLVNNKFSVADLALGSILMSLVRLDQVALVEPFVKVKTFLDKFMALDIAQKQLKIEAALFQN
jgi:glutathione S-transferase